MQKYFSGNYVFPSPKSSEDQKKRASPKIEEFLFPKSSKEQKKRSSTQFGIKFGRNLWDLFGLPGSFLSVQPALKPQWGNDESQWGDTNSRWGDVSPQQLEYWVAPPFNQAASEK